MIRCSARLSISALVDVSPTLTRFETAVYWVSFWETGGRWEIKILGKRISILAGCIQKLKVDRKEKNQGRDVISSQETCTQGNFTPPCTRCGQWRRWTGSYRNARVGRRTRCGCDVRFSFLLLFINVLICLAGLPKLLQNYLALVMNRLLTNLLGRISSRKSNSRRRCEPCLPIFSQVGNKVPSKSKLISPETVRNINVLFQWFRYQDFEKSIFVRNQADPCQNGNEKVLFPPVANNHFHSLTPSKKKNLSKKARPEVSLYSILQSPLCVLIVIS